VPDEKWDSNRYGHRDAGNVINSKYKLVINSQIAWKPNYTKKSRGFTFILFTLVKFGKIKIV